jgi:hypothetical protein
MVPLVPVREPVRIAGPEEDASHSPDQSGVPSDLSGEQSRPGVTIGTPCWLTYGVLGGYGPSHHLGDEKVLRSPSGPSSQRQFRVGDDACHRSAYRALHTGRGPHSAAATLAGSSMSPPRTPPI